ncbi:peptide chain release factor 2 [Herpetosiphon giganteus]|uniref:peptide chain release factor 2 n=1 Tax=Herpetosiphon giganteus TaxID=2029754 RepID=UPI001959A796|nr:peptide chain release factor 2 [Herpetosiphon giganteus]
MTEFIDLRALLSSLQARFDALRGRLDWAAKQAELHELEQQAADPALWENPQQAQTTLQRLARMQEELKMWDSLAVDLATLRDLLQLSADDPDSLNQIEREVSVLAKSVDTLELSILLGEKYDSTNAFISIQSGAGGVESQDWAQMLLRMYSRWGESQGFRTTIVDLMDGEEAGIKSATLELRGPYAYGYAKAEAGIHRLVRLSPFDANHRRHTSFARVEVLPEVDDAAEVKINPEDLRVDVYRAGGHGGQGVNTTDSAVRLVYRGGTPDEIIVTCQNERSQLQNKETAMNVLRARLLERELARQAAERNKLKGEHRDAAWGNQIRSYVLDDRRVKDHRTNVETSNTQAVLDGEINLFIDAFLRWRTEGAE